jgi:hypothetical protein
MPPVVVVDGLLDDWGGGSDFVGTSQDWFVGLNGSHSGFAYSFMLEDTPGNTGHSTALGPNSGGQDYDSEFIGVGIDAGRLVIVIVTGQRPDNGAAYYSPGDIRIETSGGIYGVEVGGGRGGVNYSSIGNQFDGGDAGSYFKLTSSGYTNVNADSGGYTNGAKFDSTSHVAGSIWLTDDNDWKQDPIPGGSGPAQGPPNYAGNEYVQLQFDGGTYVDDALSYVYRFTNGTEGPGAVNLGQHAVIELAIDLKVFNGASIDLVQWAPSCGNDFVWVTPGIITITETPEPSTLVLGLLGTCGVAGLRWRRRRAA